jgi:hydrogenase maturation protease
MNSKEIKGQGTRHPAPYRSVLVMGIGNILLSDEGVGIRIIEALQKKGYPDYVEVIDGGTGTLDLLEIISNRERVIIIDAVTGGSKPGTVYRFTPDDIRIKKLAPVSTHQFGFMEILDMAKLMGDLPHSIIIIGIEPEILNWGMNLSPVVSASIPKVLELIEKEIFN